MSPRERERSDSRQGEAEKKDGSKEGGSDVRDSSEHRARERSSDGRESRDGSAKPGDKRDVDGGKRSVSPGGKERDGKPPGGGPGNLPPGIPPGYAAQYYPPHAGYPYHPGIPVSAAGVPGVAIDPRLPGGPVAIDPSHPMYRASLGPAVIGYAPGPMGQAYVHPSQIPRHYMSPVHEAGAPPGAGAPDKEKALLASPGAGAAHPSPGANQEHQVSQLLEALMNLTYVGNCGIGGMFEVAKWAKRVLYSCPL